MDELQKRPGTISRKGFLRAGRNALIGGVAISAGLWPYLCFERGWFKVSGHELGLPGLPPSLDGFRLVHLSDLHFSEFITPERFGEVVEIVLAEQPDLIAITGDFIDRRTDLDLLPTYLKQLQRLAATFGTVAVMGNHDHWVDVSLVRALLAEAGIRELCNSHEAIAKAGERMLLVGLDSYTDRFADLPKAVAGLPEDGTAILLVHEPDYADISAEAGRFSLQLSGHSHGGQIYVPGYGPPVTPEYGRKYPRGYYEIDGMQLYTTSGVGMVPPYVRLNCRPEVAVLRLRAEVRDKENL